MAVLCREGVAMLLIEVSYRSAASMCAQDYKLCERSLG